MSFRSLVLPIAIVLGLILHKYCGMLYCMVPYTVFTMLFLNYTAVDASKMTIRKLHWILLSVQVAMCLGLYFILDICGVSEIISHGVLVGIITPVAASVIVISCALGANRESVTTFTMLDNLMVSIVAPIIFSFIGTHTDMPFFQSFWKIFCRICPQIVFPFFTALLLQKLLPKVNSFLSKYKWTTLYVWAFTLTLVLGKTADDIITSPNPMWGTLGILSGISVVLCAIQFGLGKWLGKKRGEEMAGGQLLGQKNTSFGIWMAIEYLNPHSAVFPAIYSVCQNLFNSWQMYVHDKKHMPET